MTTKRKNRSANTMTAPGRRLLLTLLWILVTGAGSSALAAPAPIMPGRQPAGDTLVVAKDGSGDFSSIQKAIEATKAYPPNRWVIFIKEGIYNERVRIPVWNPDISLIGADRTRTVIRYGSYFGQVNKGRNSTFYTATVRIEAAGVICRHLTIENTAGPVGQAIALYISADRCLIEDCAIEGNQDTFFATGGATRVFVKDCLISGTTDFLFGDATVLLRHCDILCKADSYIVAASTPKDQPYGFVLDHCRLQATEGVSRVLLGRPWRPYARTVYLNTVMGKFIAPVGWDNWRSKANESTARYAEYKSTIKGVKEKAVVKNRAGWSRQLSKSEANRYSPENILGNWIDHLE